MIRTNRWLMGVALAAALGVAACSFQVGKKELLDERENAPYRVRGTAVIEGQVRVRKASGEEVYGSSCQVQLVPVTTENTQWVSEVVVPGGSKEPVTHAGAVRWVSVADDIGRFRFTDLPAGDYYLTCLMAWTDDGKAHKAIAYARTIVTEGETMNVAVTRDGGR